MLYSAYVGLLGSVMCGAARSDVCPWAAAKWTHAGDASTVSILDRVVEEIINIAQWWHKKGVNHTTTVQEALWALNQVFDGAESRGTHHERISDTAEEIKAFYQREEQVKTYLEVSKLCDGRRSSA